MLQTAARLGPTPEQYKVVKDVHKLTGILTVKDKETGHPKARSYGEEFVPSSKLSIPDDHLREDKAVASPSIGGFDAHTRFIRAMEVALVGTPKLPQGIAIAGCEVWARTEYGMEDFKAVKWYPDISTEEMNRLRSWANDIPWVDDKHIAAADKHAREAAQSKLRSQMDPVGHMSDVMAKAMAAQSKTPTPEETLRAAGFVFDEKTGTWSQTKVPAK